MAEESKLKVGVLFGGLSLENEVSLATGRYIYSLLDPQKFKGIPLYLDGWGRLWQVPDKLVIQNTTADLELRLEKEAIQIHFEDLSEKIDLVFNALLGKYGEDGCIQGLLEMLGLAYTGSGILASALGMDKKIHKRLIAAAGLKVAKDVIVQKSKFRDQKEIEDWKLKIENSFGFPCVVKPTREGSSIGVAVVKKEDKLLAALEKAFEYDREVLVEEYLRGLEFTCVVWGNDEPQAMLPTEVVFEGDFFTYEGKYMPGRTQTITPARVQPEVIKEIQRIALEVYELVGCVGYGRVDGFVVRKDKDRELNESDPQLVPLQPPDPGSGRDNGGLAGSNRANFGNLGLKDLEVYVTEPHTGTIMVPSSFVFQQASKFRVELRNEFTGQKNSVPLTPRMLVTRIIEFALEAHDHKKGLL